MAIASIDLPPSGASGAGTGFRVDRAAYEHAQTEEELLSRIPFFIQGSGGIQATMSVRYVSGAPIQIVEQPKTVAAVIAEIEETFRLNKTDLTKVLRASTRKSVYNWISGDAKPRKNTLNRIYNLMMVARAWKHAGISISQEDLTRPVSSGKSLLDLLCNDAIDEELILFSGSRLSLSIPPQPLADPFASDKA